MTVENQNTSVVYENVYQGKKWSIGTLLGIFAVICASMIVRDIGMSYIYSSIYDNVAELGMPANTISFWSYLFVALLFAIPFIMPIIIMLKKGAYFDEPASSLLPSFGKVGTVLMTIVIVAICVVPVSVTAIGIFSSPYLFVAVNLLMVLLSNVVIFYYFGTYLLQRAKATLIQKYLFLTVIMAVVNVVSIAISAISVMFILKPSVVTYFKTYTESAENSQEWLLPGIFIVLSVVFAVIVAGLLYHLTQNILYAVVPVFIFSYPNVVLFQRINEASSIILPKEQRLANILNSPSLAEEVKTLQQEISSEQTAMVLCYVGVALLFVGLAALAVRAIIGLITHLKEEKAAK